MRHNSSFTACLRIRGMSTMSVRERKTTEEKDDPSLMDRDDQDRLVQQLQDENARQQAQMERIFGYICRTAAMISILLAVFVHLRQTSSHSTAQVLGWAHVSISAILHVNTSSLHQPSNALSSKIIRPAALNVLVACGGLFLARRRRDDDRLHLHYSLLASNVLVLFMGFWLRREQRLTQESLNDLKASKYHYKSL